MSGKKNAGKVSLNMLDNDFQGAHYESLKGNPVQIGDGPAAVTGDKFRNYATVFENGKARNKDEPEVRRPALKNYAA